MCEHFDNFPQKNKIIVNEDSKDVKYVYALICAYERSKHVLKSDRGDMETFKCLETKFEKTTQF